jgi:tetratricopeptide (TPR) repeat protein
VTHYQLLGLDAECSDDEIERSYERARTMEAGTFAARLAAELGAEAVLGRVVTAYEVLRSLERRRQYDEYLLYREQTSAIEEALGEGERRTSFVPPRVRSSAIRPKSGVSEEHSTAPSHLPAQEVTTDYLLAAIRKSVPRGARRKRAERLVRDAMTEREAGNLVEATNALRLVHSIVPDCEVLEGALARVAREMNRSLASTLRTRAMQEEDLKMWEEAAETWEKVLLGQPGDARAARGVAEALLEAGGDLNRALRRAEEAAEATPEDPTSQRTLARVYIAAGMEKSARRALNLAESLESEADDPRG